MQNHFNIIIVVCFIIFWNNIYLFLSYSRNITLTTAVQTEPTHWKQTALWLETSKVRQLQCGDRIVGKIIYTRLPDCKRHYSISAEWKFVRDDSRPNVLSDSDSELFKQTFLLQ